MNPIQLVVVLLACVVGGGLLAAGVWLGYRMGYQAQTGLTPSPISEPDYGGAVLDYADPRDYDDQG